MKIVSLLPSATEILCALGLRDQLVGVTHECDFPPSVKGLPVVTTTKIPKDLDSGAIDQMVRQQLEQSQSLYSLKQEVLQQLQPDLIVTQALCDVCAVAAEEVCAVAQQLPGNPQVVNLEPMSLGDVLDTIQLVADTVGCPQRGIELRRQLQGRVDKVRQRSQALVEPTRVVMLEWLDPLFNAGHWTPELVQWAGGVDPLAALHQPSHTLEWQQLIDAQPEVLVIALCGFDLPRTLKDIPLLQQRPGWSELPCVSNGRVYAVDGNAYFSRSGPRLVDSLELVAHLLHPGVHSLPAHITPAVTVA